MQETLLSPPEFDPRTLQPVDSRYTVYAIPAHKFFSEISNIFTFMEISTPVYNFVNRLIDIKFNVSPHIQTGHAFDVKLRGQDFQFHVHLYVFVLSRRNARICDISFWVRAK